MSKRQKRLERFLAIPKDFRWDELVTVMEDLGFDLDRSGGGSHGHFVLRTDPDKVIATYRPHPNGIMYSVQIKETVKKLKELGVLK